MIRCLFRFASPQSASRTITRKPTANMTSFFSSRSEELEDRPSLSLDDMPFLHHGKRPRFRNYKKFKSPRKRASVLLHQLNTEAVEKSKAEKPSVWDVDFRVGDSIEMEVVAQGGASSDQLEKIRGVVLGIFKNKLDTSVLIRDIVMGTPVERRIPLHSPLLKSVKLLEKNFVFKGKRKVKRAKLYYLRDRNPNGKKCVPSLVTCLSFPDTFILIPFLPFF